MVESSKTKKSMPRGLCPVGDCFHGAIEAAEHGKTVVGKKPGGGWKATMPYILGNNEITRLAMFGLQANFMVYIYHMEQVQANIWTIAVASFASLMGLVMLTLSAGVPALHPPSCSMLEKLHGQCQGPTAPQVAFMSIALGFLSIGAGGIKPCNVPFGVNQFDPASEDGQKGVRSFYNWYYTSFTVAQLIAQTVIVYVTYSIGFVWGFVILTFPMTCSIGVFFLGTRIYVHVKPERSVMIGVVQVFVAAYRKRQVADGLFYDPPAVEEQSTLVTRLPRTDKYRFLNKAAIIVEGDLDRDGSPTNKWRLSSIQQVEEVKCLLNILPVWASGIISFTPMVQQNTQFISQALKMDRHLGPYFQIPPASFIVKNGPPRPTNT